MKNIALNALILFCLSGTECFSNTFKPSTTPPEAEGNAGKLWENENNTLLDFKASYNSNFTLLEWRIEKENSVDHYVVEVSTDGEKFEPIAEVKSIPNTPSFKTYSFTDNSNLLVDSYYRLRLISIDGVYSYSSVVMVKVNPLHQLRLFPVPVKTVLNIKGYFGNSDQIHVAITDLNGTNYPVYNLIRVSDDHYTVDFSSFTSNTYFVNIACNGKSASYRIFKK